MSSNNDAFGIFDSASDDDEDDRESRPTVEREDDPIEERAGIGFVSTREEQEDDTRPTLDREDDPVEERAGTGFVRTRQRDDPEPEPDPEPERRDAFGVFDPVPEDRPEPDRPEGLAEEDERLRGVGEEEDTTRRTVEREDDPIEERAGVGVSPRTDPERDDTVTEADPDHFEGPTPRGISRDLAERQEAERQLDGIPEETVRDVREGIAADRPGVEAEDVVFRVRDGELIATTPVLESLTTEELLGRVARRTVREAAGPLPHEVLDEQIEDFDVGPDDIELSPVARDDPDPIQFLDRSFVLTEEAQREIAARRLDEQIEDFDIGAEDVERTHRGFVLTEDAEADIAAQRLDAQLPDREITAEDVVRDGDRFTVDSEIVDERAVDEDQTISQRIRTFIESGPEREQELFERVVPETLVDIRESLAERRVSGREFEEGLFPTAREIGTRVSPALAIGLAPAAAAAQEVRRTVGDRLDPAVTFLEDAEPAPGMVGVGDLPESEPTTADELTADIREFIADVRETVQPAVTTVDEAESPSGFIGLGELPDTEGVGLEEVGAEPRLPIDPIVSAADDVESPGGFIGIGDLPEAEPTDVDEIVSDIGAFTADVREFIQPAVTAVDEAEPPGGFIGLGVLPDADPVDVDRVVGTDDVMGVFEDGRVPGGFLGVGDLPEGEGVDLSAFEEGIGEAIAPVTDPFMDTVGDVRARREEVGLAGDPEFDEIAEERLRTLPLRAVTPMGVTGVGTGVGRGITQRQILTGAGITGGLLAADQVLQRGFPEELPTRPIEAPAEFPTLPIESPAELPAQPLDAPAELPAQPLDAPAELPARPIEPPAEIALGVSPVAIVREEEPELVDEALREEFPQEEIVITQEMIEEEMRRRGLDPTSEDEVQEFVQDTSFRFPADETVEPEISETEVLQERPEETVRDIVGLGPGVSERADLLPIGIEDTPLDEALATDVALEETTVQEQRLVTDAVLDTPALMADPLLTEMPVEQAVALEPVGVGVGVGTGIGRGGRTLEVPDIDFDTPTRRRRRRAIDVEERVFEFEVATPEEVLQADTVPQ